MELMNFISYAKHRNTLGIGLKIPSVKSSRKLIKKSKMRIMNLSLKMIKQKKFNIKNVLNAQETHFIFFSISFRIQKRKTKRKFDVRLVESFCQLLRVSFMMENANLIRKIYEKNTVLH
jgi:hypothetical protein